MGDSGFIDAIVGDVSESPDPLSLHVLERGRSGALDYFLVVSCGDKSPPPYTIMTVFSEALEPDPQRESAAFARLQEIAGYIPVSPGDVPDSIMSYYDESLIGRNLPLEAVSYVTAFVAQLVHSLKDQDRNVVAIGPNALKDEAVDAWESLFKLLQSVEIEKGKRYVERDASTPPP